MNLQITVKLSSVLFKSYFRATRGRISTEEVQVGQRGKTTSTSHYDIHGGRSRVSTYSKPSMMFCIDAALSLIAFLFLHYLFFPGAPSQFIRSFEPIAVEFLVGLPLGITSAIIFAGILFELGQGGGSSGSSAISSSEAINWLPLTAKEYVLASALSISLIYSPFFALGIGITLAIALEFALMHVWFAAVAFSVVGLLLGSFIVEILRAVMNAISTAVYKRRGRAGIITRLLLVVVLLVTLQISFNSYILFRALNSIIRGITAAWFIPMVWPSLALLNIIKGDFTSVIILSGLVVAFTVLLFELGSGLRQKYWSTTSAMIVLTTTHQYVPARLQSTSSSTLSAVIARLGVGPAEISIALKEFRVLTRRKDMARFIAVPVLLMVSFFIPALISAQQPQQELRYRQEIVPVQITQGLVLTAAVSLTVPLMFSSMSIGQEGRFIINLCMLPISPKELITGKLIVSWTISAITVIATITILGLISGVGILFLTLVALTGLFSVVATSYIGLSIGARYPQFTMGPRSSYVTLSGFAIGFILCTISTLVVFAPVTLYSLAHMHNTIQAPGQSYTSLANATLVILSTVAIGLSAAFLGYRYCFNGIKKLLTNLEF